MAVHLETFSWPRLIGTHNNLSAQFFSVCGCFFFFATKAKAKWASQPVSTGNQQQEATAQLTVSSAVF